MTQQNVSELAKQGNAVVQKYIRLYFFLNLELLIK